MNASALPSEEKNPEKPLSLVVLRARCVYYSALFFSSSSLLHSIFTADPQREKDACKPGSVTYKMGNSRFDGVNCVGSERWCLSIVC